jgi:hypothetical protein
VSHSNRCKQALEQRQLSPAGFAQRLEFAPGLAAVVPRLAAVGQVVAQLQQAAGWLAVALLVEQGRVPPAPGPLLYRD